MTVRSALIARPDPLPLLRLFLGTHRQHWQATPQANLCRPTLSEWCPLLPAAPVRPPCARSLNRGSPEGTDPKYARAHACLSLPESTRTRVCPYRRVRARVSVPTGEYAHKRSRGRRSGTSLRCRFRLLPDMRAPKATAGAKQSPPKRHSLSIAAKPWRRCGSAGERLPRSILRPRPWQALAAVAAEYRRADQARPCSGTARPTGKAQPTLD